MVEGRITAFVSHLYRIDWLKSSVGGRIFQNGGISGSKNGKLS